jgi:hypothetical protein
MGHNWMKLKQLMGNMKILLALALYLSGAVCLKASAVWRPDERLMDAVCQVESSGGRFVSGDAGSSLGHFQMQKGAWADVVAWRKKQGLPTHNYQTNVFDSGISRLYAADYLTILHTHLKAQYNREPTAGELYAAYNMGLNGFRKCHYNLAEVNPVTRGKCNEIMAAVTVKNPPSAIMAVISVRIPR